MAKKADDTSWQDEYARELLRTSGLKATFEKGNGGWWELYVDGQKSYSPKRRSDFLKMTETLKTRPDAADVPVKEG